MGEQLRRVTIVDAHAMFADLLAQSLDRRGYRCRVIVAAPTSSPAALARAVADSRPEVVVVGLDLRCGGGDGVSLLRMLAGAGHRVVAVTETAEPVRRGEAFHRGAQSVVAKTTALPEFVSVVRRTMYGVPTVGREERRRLVDLFLGEESGRAAAAERLASLSRQERVILEHLMAGRPVREIAAIRVVSPQTVRSQVKAVLAKLQVSSQGQAVALAWSNGWQPAAA